MGSITPASRHTVHSGSQCPPNTSWNPFSWHEPNHGPQSLGEFTLARAFGTTGDIKAGFWRLCLPDSNSLKSSYSSPDGDEISVIIDGTASLTVVPTGEKYRVGPGDIVSCPKGLEVEWEYDGPYIKKYWCRWNGTSRATSSAAAAAAPTKIQINNINDNPKQWTPYRRSDGENGELVSGELYMIWSAGSTGSLKSGIWRSGRGIPSTNVEEDGRMVNPYVGATGDETMLLLEGEVDIIETESGKVHNFRAGDAFGLSAGMHVTWISRAPFVRKLWVITNDWDAQE